MGDMDQVTKRLGHLRGPDLLAAPGAVFNHLLPTEPAAEPQLMLDTLLLVEVDGEECLVDREMQTDLDRTMPRRLFESGARASIVEGKMVRAALEGWFGRLDAEVLQALGGADEATLMEMMRHSSSDSLEQVRSRLGVEGSQKVSCGE